MALNDRTKNRFRRVIRGVMVVLAAVLLLLGLGVPVANNALAMGEARSLAALPLPEDTTVAETVSLAVRVTNPRGSMQYVGAILLESGRSLEELQGYFAQYTADLTQPYYVARVQKQTLALTEDTTLTFREPVEESGYYVVYRIRTGGYALQWWLDMDMRG